MKPEDKAKVQIALDALEKLWMLSVQTAAIANPGITALRQLLEQPEPEPEQSAERGEQFDPKFLDDLKKLMGLPPHDTFSNTAMGDGYFSAHLIGKHGREKFDAAVAYLRSGATSTPPAQPPEKGTS
jgi:hypothetical protein